MFPFLSAKTTEGVLSSPNAFLRICTSFCWMMATEEFVVPKSIPISIVGKGPPVSFLVISFLKLMISCYKIMTSISLRLLDVKMLKHFESLML